MPKYEEKKKCCQSWSPCGPKFWNDFFRPKHGIVFIILILVIIFIAYTLCYIILAVLVESICKEHENAFLIFFFSNLILMLVGIFLIHFLSVNPNKLTNCLVISMYVAIIIAFALSITSIILWNFEPSNSDIKEYIVKFLKEYDRVPRVYDQIQQDYKCCGVTSFWDYAGGKTGLERLPDSCCRKRLLNETRDRKDDDLKDCGNFRGRYLNLTKTYAEVFAAVSIFYLEGCFRNSSYKDLEKESPSVYKSLHLIIDWAFLSPGFLFVTLAILSYYTCYKLPREDDKPAWAQEDSLMASMHCFKQNDSFAKLHSKSQPKLAQGLELEQGPSSATDTVGSTGTVASSTTGVESDNDGKSLATSNTTATTKKGVQIGVDDKGKLNITSDDNKSVLDGVFGKE